MKLLAIAVAAAHELWIFGPPTTVEQGMAGLVVQQTGPILFVAHPIGRGQLLLDERGGWPDVPLTDSALAVA